MFIFLIFITLCIFCDNIENLSQDLRGSNIENILKLNIPILGDSMFENSSVFTNDELWHNPNGKTGIEKCKNVCNGNCVEYGISGNAICFSK
jgi:hypothetical protein